MTGSSVSWYAVGCYVGLATYVYRRVPNPKSSRMCLICYGLPCGVRTFCLCSEKLIDIFHNSRFGKKRTKIQKNWSRADWGIPKGGPGRSGRCPFPPWNPPYSRQGSRKRHLQLRLKPTSRTLCLHSASINSD